MSASFTHGGWEGGKIKGLVTSALVIAPSRVALHRARESISSPYYPLPRACASSGDPSRHAFEAILLITSTTPPDSSSLLTSQDTQTSFATTPAPMQRMRLATSFFFAPLVPYEGTLCEPGLLCVDRTPTRHIHRPRHYLGRSGGGGHVLGWANVVARSLHATMILRLYAGGSLFFCFP